MQHVGFPGKLLTSNKPSTEQNRIMAVCAALVTESMSTTFVMAADKSVECLVWHLVMMTFVTKA